MHLLNAAGRQHEAIREHRDTGRLHACIGRAFSQEENHLGADDIFPEVEKVFVFSNKFERLFFFSGWEKAGLQELETTLCPVIGGRIFQEHLWGHLERRWNLSAVDVTPHVFLRYQATKINQVAGGAQNA